MDLELSTTNTADETLTILRQRNLLSPIYRLPPETLRDIFLRAKSSLKYTRSLARSLISISSVSHRWRQVTLDIPQFWMGDYEVVPPKLLELFLTRSKEMPLYIDLTKHSEWYPHQPLIENISTTLPYIDRWRTFRVKFYADLGYFGDIMKGLENLDVANLLSPPAPNLECLSIAIDPYEGIAFEPTPGSPFGGVTPSLQELDLENIFFQFSSPIYSNLTRLRIKECAFTNSEILTSFLGALRASPRLEYLVLKGFQGVMEDDDPINIPMVELNHLKGLWLDFYEASYVPRSILSNIIAPPSSYFHLVSLVEQGDGLLGLVPACTGPEFGLKNLLGITDLVIETNDLDGILIMRPSENDRPTLHTQIHATNDAIPLMISQLGIIFPMQLESLTLSAFPDPYDALLDALTTFLSSQPDIRKICFYECDTAFVSIVAAVPGNFPCPQLRELHLVECSIDEEQLVSVVESRLDPAVHPACRLERLSFTQLRIPPETIARLRRNFEVVEDALWDYNDVVGDRAYDDARHWETF